MFETVREMLANQYAAALSTLKVCIDRCPDTAWDAPVANQPFCRIAFHTLFYADYYLGRDVSEFREQAFHKQHESFFSDYEEFEYREPELIYERRPVLEYVDHCHHKADDVMRAETPESLTGPSGFPRRTFSRGELHVYNIRHIQHHAAQLSLRLRLDFAEDIPWIGSGWKDVSE